MQDVVIMNMFYVSNISKYFRHAIIKMLGAFLPYFSNVEKNAEKRLILRRGQM